jgi:hypothetical protein
MVVVVAVLALAALAPLASFAGGAGGFTWGEDWYAPGASSGDLGLRTSGVYGYGTSWAGQRAGGFAMSVSSGAEGSSLDGGFVGAIAGQEMRAGPVVAALTLWTGVGGLGEGAFAGRAGSLALFGELCLELGFAFVPGMQLTGYAGMQAIAPVAPWPVMAGSALYSPVVGVRLSWGR